MLAWKLGWPLKGTFIDNFDITGLNIKFSLFFHNNFVSLKFKVTVVQVIE